MKTAISLPDADFERFDRIAQQHGMSRSEFYRHAAARFADELDGAAELTAIADAVIDAAGQPAGDALFLRSAEHTVQHGTAW